MGVNLSLSNLDVALLLRSKQCYLGCYLVYTKSSVINNIVMQYGGVWCERPADVPGHYGGHPRPQVADKGTPSRVAQEGSTG